MAQSEKKSCRKNRALKKAFLLLLGILVVDCPVENVEDDKTGD